MQYTASLFRGWEVVRLEYALDGDCVILRRRRTWQRRQEQRVEIAALSGEVRRVWARQPAFVLSTIVIVLVVLILCADAIYHGLATGGIADIHWPLWGLMLALAGLAWMVRFKTRRRAQWSHFVGASAGGGMFVLRDPRNAKAHQKFVAALRKRLPSPRKN